MNTNQICIILCYPDECRNIGSVCRAMANMGFNDLRIVGNNLNYDNQKIQTLALHAYPIWTNAKFFSSITEATKDCVLAAGTTRRVGKKRKNWLLTPEEFVLHCHKTVKNAKVALVFGNERTGLTDEELTECTIGVTIPSHDDFPSLNLSHAVQIMCYEFFKFSHKMNKSSSYTPITLERLNRTVKHISENQKKIGFFSVTGQKDMENFWTSILSRASLSEGEAKYLEKIFTKTAGLIGKTQTENP